MQLAPESRGFSVARRRRPAWSACNSAPLCTVSHTSTGQTAPGCWACRALSPWTTSARRKSKQACDNYKQVDTVMVASRPRCGVLPLESYTHPRLTALFPWLPRSAGTGKVKPIWVLLKQETVSGSGISLVICKSAPSSKETTTPAPHHSDFYRPDALPAAQPTASKHWGTGELVWEYKPLHVSPTKVPLPARGSESPSNTWILGPSSASQYRNCHIDWFSHSCMPTTMTRRTHTHSHKPCHSHL